MYYPIPDQIIALPRWAQVAFASHCARSALPLFERFWPGARPDRRAALESAIHLAQQTARDGAPAEGLEGAEIRSIMAAGAAILTDEERAMAATLPKELPEDESSDHEAGPPNPQAGQIASFAAKSAEWAAVSAMGGRPDGTNAAVEAFIFAREAAYLAKLDWIADRLERDLAGLRRVVARGKWSSDTRVPPSIFDLLSDEPAEKPWWRFW